ncbi:AgmX/PglI C-terminal domain-containing protein [Sandaracinus amylolyticus]|uniref:AgmX/PglI C-terminal domain-containing protein n=1 Tax=Sandaracinus amylolyticus TaxID=927083 RepID=A0A0F6YFM5_9BACT|nr:AgmX/PglI C-terminal domain-containing protein [Sandaracinus amylolyticus]AKF02872.1 hypothetical protein DB32_000020 [Sandaracinus amylolyticus]
MLRPPLIVLGALSLVTLVACGSAPSRSVASRPRRATIATGAIQSGAVYTIDHDVEERLDGVLQRVRHTRVVLWIGARGDDGAYPATATLTQQQEGDQASATVDVVLQLAPDGTLRGDPILVCDRGGDDLADARFIRHVIAPYPRARSSELFVEQREQPLVARTRRVADGLRAEATLELDDDPIALAHATGLARVRVIADLDEVDAMAFDVRTRIEGTSMVRDDGTPERSRAVRIDEHTRSVRTGVERPPSTSCGYDVRAVIRRIQAQQHVLRGCYQQQLRDDPALRGRIKVRMTIEAESGEVTGVRVVERSMPGARGEAVAACIVEEMDGWVIDPGPEGASVTYQFPFVFEP